MSLVSGIVDPIVLVASFTVFDQLLPTDIWRVIRQHWDDELPKDPVQKLFKWSMKLQKLDKTPIPANYYWGTFRNLQLLIIGGSSQEISSAVALLRALVNSLNWPKTELAVVLGKSRVRAMNTKTPKSWNYKLR